MIFVLFCCQKVNFVYKINKIIEKKKQQKQCLSKQFYKYSSITSVLVNHQFRCFMARNGPFQRNLTLRLYPIDKDEVDTLPRFDLRCPHKTNKQRKFAPQLTTK